MVEKQHAPRKAMQKKFHKQPIDERIIERRIARMRKDIEDSRRASADVAKTNSSKASFSSQDRGTGQKAPTEILSSRMQRLSADLVDIGFTEFEAHQVARELSPAAKALQKRTDLQLGAVNEFMRNAFAMAIGNNSRVFEKIKNDPVFRKAGVEGVLARQKSRAR
jgi:hypothetical protein